ncbi:Uncharacterised protein [uncultured archaeon]|nr:Uncharacterised protein [uncultured archaeon]
MAHAGIDKDAAKWSKPVLWCKVGCYLGKLGLPN